MLHTRVCQNTRSYVILTRTFEKATYLPGSKPGAAIGESSRLQKSIPSVARFGFGGTSSHETCPRTLQKEINSWATKLSRKIPNNGNKIYTKEKPKRMFFDIFLIVRLKFLTQILYLNASQR